MNCLRNALSCERLFSESALDIIQNFGMRRIRFVERIPEREIRWSKPVTEVLGEDPSAVYDKIEISVVVWQYIVMMQY